MGPPQNDNRVTLRRSLLWMLLLSAFALGIFIDRGIGLFSDDAEWRRGPSAGAASDKRVAALRSSVLELIRQRKSEGAVSACAVYFLELTGGDEFGIDENDEFYPPQFMPLPVMIAYLKEAGTDPGVLERKVLFSGPRKRPDAENMLQRSRLEPGRSYPVRDLIYRMVVFNDQDALALLSSRLPDGAAVTMLADIGIDAPSEKGGEISLRDYALLFQILYTASYLDRSLSETVLRFLSRSSFRDGIIAGVPPDIPVASRFGEIEYPDAGNDRYQIHDIGIVSLPGHPYLLGVRTLGNDPRQQTRIIRDISRLVHADRDRRKKH